jgi:ribonuclease HI
MRLNNNPCKACTEHTAECHAACEAYRKAKEEHEVLKAKIREDSHIKEYMADARFKRNKRYMK